MLRTKNRLPLSNWSLWTSCLLLAIALVGCQQNSRTEQSKNESPPDITAAEILATVKQQYRDASSYQDNAVLYLTYRLNGRAIQEPNPWSIAWTRDGQYSANLFNAKVRCDGKSLSCYVFDIETGNVDNQHLLIPASPFGRLLNDKIASHFVFGTSELPLDELETTRRDHLVPPMIGFSEPQLLPDWLRAPTKVQRLEDDESIGESCYVLKLHSEGKEYRAWINQKSGVIEQIEFPLQYLDSQILASEQVTNLRFFARLHDARLDDEVAADQFKIATRMATKQVDHFVTLPEPLPCLKLGEEVGDVVLQNPTNDSLAKVADLYDAPTTLLWITGFSANDLIGKFGELAKGIGSDNHRFAVVYSDDSLASPGTASSEIDSRLGNALASAQLPALYDPKMNASAELEIKAVPSVIVLDKANRVQFAKAIDSKDWTEDVKIALDRVAKGENVASEMKTEYQKYLDEYHQQLALAMTTTRGDSRTATGQPVSGVDMKGSTKAKLVWESRSLKDPGNIHIPWKSDQLFVLDGWQTVVEFDSRGDLINRFNLSLPEGVGVNRIRSLVTNEGKRWFVAFSMLGKQAFVFNDAWEKVLEYPEAGNGGETSGISQVQLTESRSGSVDLWMSFIDKNGIRKIDVRDGTVEQVIDKPCRGFCLLGGKLVVVDGGKVHIGGKQIPGLAKWNSTTLLPGPDSLSCCTVCRNDQEAWKLFCIDHVGTVKWSHPILPQFFDNDIESLAYGSGRQRGPSGGSEFAISASNNSSAMLFDLQENTPVKVEFGWRSAVQPLRGIAAWSSSEHSASGARLVTSTKDGVQCWEIPGNRTQIIPASTQLNR